MEKDENKVQRKVIYCLLSFEDRYFQNLMFNLVIKLKF